MVPKLASGKQMAMLPPEWAEQEAVWMGWSDSPALHDVQISVAISIMSHARICMLITSVAAEGFIKDRLCISGCDLRRIEFFLSEVTNVWTRDAGPRFLLQNEKLAVADFGWNFYGLPSELISHNGLRRGEINRIVSKAMDIPIVSSSINLEGGAVEVNNSTVLGYRETILQRNPGIPLERLEAELTRVLGKERFIWLDRCPIAEMMRPGPKVSNYFGISANGHIDEFVRFVSEETVLVAQIGRQEKSLDPISALDFEVLRDNLRQLRMACDPKGRRLRVIPVPTPTRIHFRKKRCLTPEMISDDFGRAFYWGLSVGDEFWQTPALSYLNYFVTNGAVLVPAYWREGLPETERDKDEFVVKVFRAMFPSYQIYQIDPLPLNWDGGGIHCITQQQPSVHASGYASNVKVM